MQCNSEQEGSDRLVEHIEVVCPSDRPMNGGKKDEPVPVKKYALRHDLNIFNTPSHLKSLKKWDFPVTDRFDVGVVVLAKELGTFGADCVLKTLRDLPQCKKTAVVQDDAKASKAPKLTLQDGFLSLNESANAIFHLWQALSNSVGVSVQFRDKVVKLIEIRLPSADDLQSVQADEARNGPSTVGTFFFEKKRQALWLRCSEDSWLLISKLQQADRKVGAAIDFCNGYRLKNMQRERFKQVDVSPTGSHSK
ncbi:hypothetical protein BBJ28_00026073 [Nothophytophthora sp. Chile5]|nr:hypothetical protein BBJ28_00026073 [Nothophytophthora sp. Chile5]